MSIMKVLCRTCKSEIWVDVKADEICNSCKTKTPEKEPMYKIFDTKEQAKEHSKQFVEPELMTLQEAFEKAGNEDCIYHPEHGGAEMRIKKKNFHKNAVFGRVVFSHAWQIIPAEQKVLNAHDYIASQQGLKYLKSYREREIAIDWGKSGFDHGDKNGQLKEWLNHKELREAVEDFSHCDVKLLWPSNIYEYQDRFKALLDKLKEAK